MTDKRAGDLHLVDGKWHEVPDILADLRDGGTVDDHLEARGWSSFLSIGSDDSSMRVESWRRYPADGPVEYLVSVDDSVNVSSFLVVDTLPELMDLLARWAPAVQAAAVADLLEDLHGTSLDERGAVETIAARMRFGEEQVLPQLRRHFVDRRSQAVIRRDED